MLCARAAAGTAQTSAQAIAVREMRDLATWNSPLLGTRLDATRGKRAALSLNHNSLWFRGK
jgi:hypothetical protein